MLFADQNALGAALFTAPGFPWRMT
jgi:hypothetical protein